jgi:hypothetical protein
VSADEENSATAEAVAMINVRVIEFSRLSAGFEHLGAFESDRNGRGDQFVFAAAFIASQRAGLSLDDRGRVEMIALVLGAHRAAVLATRRRSACGGESTRVRDVHVDRQPVCVVDGHEALDHVKLRWCAGC